MSSEQIKDCLLLILGHCENSQAKESNRLGLIIATAKLFLDSHYPGWDKDKDSSIKTASDVAEKIADEVHCYQKRWDGSPYTTHTTAVADCFPVNDIRHAVGHLHDVMEDGDNIDSGSLHSMLKSGGVPHHIANEIVDAVVALTRLPNEPYVQSIARVLENKIAIDVKLADLAHNLSCDRPGNCKLSQKQTDKYLLTRFILLQEKSFQRYLLSGQLDLPWDIFSDAVKINKPLGPWELNNE